MFEKKWRITRSTNGNFRLEYKKSKRGEWIYEDYFATEREAIQAYEYTQYIKYLN